MEKSKFYTPECSLAKVQKMVGGKWKLVLLWSLSEGPQRFGELNRCLPEMTQSMLTKQLRELEKDNLIHRKVYTQVPPKVEYSLTDLGKSFFPIISTMHEWGEMYLG